MRRSKSLSSRQAHTRTAITNAVSVGVEGLESRVLLSSKVLATVIYDVNGNGVRETGDDGLQNWTVFVDYNGNGNRDVSEPFALTDIDGEAMIQGITPGTWDVREVLPNGWMPSPGYDVVINTELPNNEQIDLWFLNTTTSSTGEVQGTVWNDVDRNGVRDAGDPALSNWTTYIDLDNNGDMDAGEPSSLTDASGFYSIPNLTTGQYQVREILPLGWEPTVGYDNNYTVDVMAGSATVQDFGNFSIASVGAIEGEVWNDVNGDGIRQASDAGLGGWTVFLDTDLNGVPDVGEPSVLSDPGGVYSFPSVIAGTYEVTEVVPSGWNVSPGYSAAVTTVVVGENPSVVDFANYTTTLGSISGKVWNDVNGDGILGAGEPGLSGWHIFVDQNSDGAQNAGEPAAVTDGGGLYLLSSVPIGANELRETPVVGWEPTAPGTGMQLVTVPNGSNVSGINFGNQQRTDGSIAGLAYADYNKNHIREAGEPGLAGITVFLDTNNNSVLDTTEQTTVTSADLFYTPTVDEAGTYSFTHLPTGTYHVREIVPVLLSETLESDRVVNVTLLPGEVRTGVNFAMRFRGNEIHGIKYNDLNRNHARDAGEPGIAGVTIYLDLDRDNVLDISEPRTVTGSGGAYSFITDLSPGAYVVRELVPAGWTQTYPTTTGGTLWPTGVSNPAFGNVSPSSITSVLHEFETMHQNVSLTLPSTGALTNKVDVFLLFDDTGSFTDNSPLVRAAFPQIIDALLTSLPGIDLAFGVGRFEEYANFAGEFATGRPFILNQPIISASTPGFNTSIQSALDRTTPGYGGDEPETDIEALYQLVTGSGFDGNNNGTTTDSGSAGLVSTQLDPGVSGDVPAFTSFTIDPSGNVLPAAGVLGGAGSAAGALPIILTATDTGFAFQPNGETTTTGVGGLTLPISELTQTSRSTTPFNSGAGIQETITALNALGALVVGLGTNAQSNLDPRQQLESLSLLTGAINHSTTTIPNGTLDAIAPGDPLYFEITTGFETSVANGIVTAIQNAVANVNLNITVRPSDPDVHIMSMPGVVNGVGAGQMASFDVEFTGDDRPHRFDLQFVRQGTDVVLGSIPVVIGIPIVGDGYDFEELEDGEIDDNIDFGNFHEVAPLVIGATFEFETEQDVAIDFNQFVMDSLSLADLQVVNLGTNLPVTIQSLAYNPATNRATARFNPAVLADGRYQLRIAAGSITNQSSAYVSDFFVLAGDANRDRYVNFADLLIVAQNYGTSNRTFSQGNFNYSPDGLVNFSDLLIVAQRYGANLALNFAAQGPSAFATTRIANDVLSTADRKVLM